MKHVYYLELASQWHWIFVTQNISFSQTVFLLIVGASFGLCAWEWQILAAFDFRLWAIAIGIFALRDESSATTISEPQTIKAQRKWALHSVFAYVWFEYYVSTGQHYSVETSRNMKILLQKHSTRNFLFLNGMANERVFRLALSSFTLFLHSHCMERVHSWTQHIAPTVHIVLQ